LLDDIRQNKKQIIEKAEQEAFDIVDSSNKAIEQTIKEIKEVKADKSKTKDIRKKLGEKRKHLKRRFKTKLLKRQK
jgi:DNA mismatch repair protein MutS2